jgi:hypothetical protein
MKRAVLALVFVVLLASAAVASSVTETGVAVLLSVGDEKRPIEALMTFSDQNGVMLTPQNGVLVVPEGEAVNVQIFPKGAKGEKSFIIGYTTNTLVSRDMKRATFDPLYGWGFVLTPQETAQVPGLVRALQLSITNRDGHKSWIRVIFKITYGSGWVTQFDQLIIKTVPRSEMNVTGATGGSDATPAIEALKANQAKTAEYINSLESRVTNAENWIKTATGSNSTSVVAVASSQMVTLPVYFAGSYATIGMRVTRSDGKEEGYVVKTTGQNLTLPYGKATIDLLVNYGNGVIKKKMPIVVDIDASTRYVSIDVTRQGGAK